MTPPPPSSGAPARPQAAGGTVPADRRMRLALAILLGTFALLAVIDLILWQSADPASMAEGHSRTLIHLAVLTLAAAAAVALIEPAARAARRQLDEQAVAQAQLELLALAAARTNTMVIVTDRQDRTVWVNEGFTRMSGFTPAEAMGRPPGLLLRSPLADEQAVQQLRAAILDGVGIRVALLNRTRDGRELWLDVDLQPLYDDRGKVSGFVSVSTDITGQVLERDKMLTLLNTLPTGVVVTDAQGAVVDANAAAEQVLQIGRTALLGMTTDDPRWIALRDDGSRMPPEEQPHVRALRSGQGQRGLSMGIVTRDGVPHWLLVNSQPLRDAAGELAGTVSCFVDQSAQRTQQRLLELALSAAGAGTWQWELKSGTVRTNERQETMLGYAPGTMPMNLDGWVDLVHPEDRPRWLAAVQAHLADAAVPYHEVIRLRRVDGGWITVDSRGTVVERSARGNPRRMAGINLDISAQVQAQDALRRAARTDGLTSLPNRHVVVERLEAALARHRSHPERHFAVLFMDFDRFKQVNDTFGHAMGDELLRQIAARLVSALRPGDAVARAEPDALPVLPGAPGPTAARIGGDEFVVVLEDLPEPEAGMRVAQRLQEVLSRPYSVGAHVVHSTPSTGVVSSRHAAAEASAVLRDADTAMYEAKRRGRGCCVEFDPAMQERLAHTLAIERDLRTALATGQIYAVYQPVVALGGPGGSGVEALARWRHPLRGQVPPNEFIPVAEECGLIDAVGDHMLSLACREFMAWCAAAPDTAPDYLAVNLSRAQLLLPDLVPRVAAVLAATGMPAARLQLEITESLAAQDEVVQRTLRELKALGVLLALDDFGTGYSSLSCLHLLPVDTVKIDRSFVSHLETSEYHRVLVEATLRVARTLGMVTVAEGVETSGQAAALAALACDRGQGWLFSRPLEAGAVPAWLAARAAGRDAADRDAAGRRAAAA